MSDNTIFENKIEVIENYYCILDASTGEIVDTNNEPSGDYGYEEVNLPLSESDGDNEKFPEEIIISYADIDKKAIYSEKDLPKLKNILSDLKKEYNNDGEDFSIVKFSVKTYKYVSFNTLD
jgi:hypothetical protein